MKRKYLLLLALSGSIYLFDQWTKVFVIKHFRLGETYSLISGFFSFTYVRNTGAAFGLMAQADPSFRIPFFVAVPVLALGVIAWIFRRIPDSDVKLSTALSLVIGGAIGNLTDRLRLGYVVDFIDFHWRDRAYFPAFNVADSAICIGVAILMLDLFAKDEETTHASHSA